MLVSLMARSWFARGLSCPRASRNLRTCEELVNDFLLHCNTRLLQRSYLRRLRKLCLSSSSSRRSAATSPPDDGRGGGGVDAARPLGAGEGDCTGACAAWACVPSLPPHGIA